MESLMNIPDYPDVCRICLLSVKHQLSYQLDAMIVDEICYRQILFDFLLNQQDGLTDVEEAFPQMLCSKCHMKIEHFYTFRMEALTNSNLLKAWIESKSICSAASFDEDNTTNVTIICKIELEENIVEPEQREYQYDEKREAAVKHSLINENENTQSNDTDSFADNPDDDKYSDSEPPVTKNKRVLGPVRIVDGQRIRPCFLDNCDPVTVGQAEIHARKNHRAYCRICGLVFPSHSQVVHHLAIHRPNEQRTNCEFCDKPFWREFDLTIHKREFHGKEMNYLECPYCGKQFARRAEWTKHRETHKNCKFCPMEFKGYRFALSHMKVHHKDNLHSCKECPLVFLGRKEHELHMNKHRERVMENSIQFSIKGWIGAQCIFCDRSYYNQRYLSDHFINDHKNGLLEKPTKTMVYKKRTKEELDRLEFKFKCRECDAVFRLKTSLKGHCKKNHSGEKFICEHCGACFKSKPELKTHERYLHTKDYRYACELCDKRCITMGDLVIHKRSHTNEKPYRCTHDGCDKAYKTHAALTQHTRLHTGEKPYKCPYEGCDKAYVCNQLLKVHVRHHTLEKPFKCWYCEQFFISTNRRREHSRRYHVGKPIGRELEKMNQQASSPITEKVTTDLKVASLLDLKAEINVESKVQP